MPREELRILRRKFIDGFISEDLYGKLRRELEEEEANNRALEEEGSHESGQSDDGKRKEIGRLQGFLKKGKIPAGQYTVYQDLLVPYGSELTIEPATQLSFADDAGMIIEGTLQAIGNEHKNIVFGPIHDGWKNIVLLGKGTFGSVLEYAQLLKGKGRVLFWNAENERYQMEGEIGRGERMGAAIAAINQGFIDIHECSIIENYSVDRGAVFCGSGAAVVVKNSVIRSNRGRYSGGIAGIGSSLYIEDSCIQENKGTAVALISCESVIKKCRISQNTADSGAALFCIKGSVHISASEISHNKASGSGGGIYCQDASTSIRQCKIQGNRSGQSGGGVFLDTAHHESLISSCIVSGNESRAYGGGIYIRSDKNSAIEDCIVQNNSSAAGGGLCLDGSPSIVDCRIETNNAVRGGGLFLNRKNDSYLKGLAISRNRADIQGGGIFIDSDFEIVPTVLKRILNRVSMSMKFVIKRTSETRGVSPKLIRTRIKKNVPDSIYRGSAY